MTMQHFHRLSEMEKLASIMQWGVLKAQQWLGDRRIFVYRLDGFYVAASYSISDDCLVDMSCHSEPVDFAASYREQLVSVNPAERTG